MATNNDKPKPGERQKHLGSGLYEEARKGISRRNRALREAAEHNQPGTKYHSQRDGEDDD